MKQPDESSIIHLPGFIINGTKWFFEEDPSLKWRTVPSVLEQRNRIVMYVLPGYNIE